MATTTGPATLEDSLAELGRHWGLLLTFGILSVLIGIVALAWPEKTVAVFAIFFGAWLLVSGIFQVVEAFAKGLDGGSRAALALVGAAGIILGVLALRGGWTRSVEILALIVGLGWILRGILTLVTGLAEKGLPGRGWLIVGGLLLAVGGIVILAWPGISLVTLTIFTGAFLLVFGVIEIFGAFQARKFAGR